MIFNCPHCDQELEVEDEGAGLTVHCPNCRQSLTIPEIDLISAQPPAPHLIEPLAMPRRAKRRIDPAIYLRWILFFIILGGIAAAVYFTAMTPDIKTISTSPLPVGNDTKESGIKTNSLPSEEESKDNAAPANHDPEAGT
jgi:cytoskeletal protein RodZ